MCGSVFFNSATLDAKKKKLFYFFILFSLKRFILHWTLLLISMDIYAIVWKEAVE